MPYVHRLVLLLLIAPSALMAQKNDPWIKYANKKKDAWGYKDLEGTIKIPAHFKAEPLADTFHNIIVVQDSSFKPYYLLRNGRNVGLDSAYTFDNEFDCESEGKIRFHDKKTNKVGFFDSNGHVTIPADYDYASQFRNGISVASKNNKRRCMDADCEHWAWEGGTTALINSRNEILVTNWKENADDIDWYSMRVNAPVDTSIHIVTKGEDGNTYSFVALNKEFEKWFYGIFMNAMATSDRAKIAPYIFPNVTYWSKKESKWLQMTKQSFIERNYATLSKNMATTNKNNTAIFHEHLNQFIFTGKLYKRYYTSCGTHNEARFPVFDVVLSHHAPDYQEHFEFIRTGTGYMLHSVSMER